ncbi:MAG: transporter [Croceibacterium sp.]
MRSYLLLTLVLIASPVLADHLGPSGTGSGSGLEVIAPDTLDAGHGGIGFRLLYTRPERRSDAELNALAVQGIGAHNSDYNLNSSAGIAYGVTHHLTLSAEVPYVRRDNLREGGIAGVERLGTVAGIGDVSLLAKYRLTGEEGLRFAVIGGIKVPTGSTHSLDPQGERLETEHQPGTGSWDPVLGASAATKFGAIQMTASALYQFSGKGAQQTHLGDRLQGGISLSHHFGPTEAEHHHDEAEEHGHHHHDEAKETMHASWDAFVELGGEWEGR